MTAHQSLHAHSTNHSRVGVVNLGAGNAQSVTQSLAQIGVTAELVSDPRNLRRYSRLILPGVGAFDPVMRKMRMTGFSDAISDFLSAPERRLLGICIGMQILFGSSDEGDSSGLGHLAGHIQRLRNPGGQNFINIGWRHVEWPADADRDSSGFQPSGFFYFVHEYACVLPPEHAHVAWVQTDAGEVVGGLRQKNVWGTQFHPERSSRDGRRFLEEFVKGDG